MGFDIVTRGLPVTTDEWMQVVQTPDELLPDLDKRYLDRVQRGQGTQLQFQRRAAARQLATAREKQEAEQLGQIVETILPGLHGNYFLERIVRRGFEPGWRLLIRKQESTGSTSFFEVPLSPEALGGADTDPARTQRLSSDLIKKALTSALLDHDEIRSAG